LRKRSKRRSKEDEISEEIARIRQYQILIFQCSVLLTRLEKGVSARENNRRASTISEVDLLSIPVDKCDSWEDTCLSRHSSLYKAIRRPESPLHARPVATDPKIRLPKLKSLLTNRIEPKIEDSHRRGAVHSLVDVYEMAVLEWYFISRVLDRIFFVIFTLATILLYSVVFCMPYLTRHKLIDLDRYKTVC
ncbi:hypothetical protein Ciccas_011989, partial [Cichlidogyrus casuarinus]